MSREFETILDECLQRLLEGESVEHCLARYPEQAAELEPLLQVALAAREASAIEPRPEFKAQARYRLQSALTTGLKRRQRRGLRLRWQWALPLAIVFFLILAGGSTVAASSASLPDEHLYPVKTRVEQIRLWLTPTDMGKARLHAQFVNRRTEEIAQMVHRDKTEVAVRVAHRLEAHLQQIRRRAHGPGIHDLRQFLQQHAAGNLATLQALEEERPALRPALERAREAYLETLQAIQGGGE